MHIKVWITDGGVDDDMPHILLRGGEAYGINVNCGAGEKSN